jgi:hypothetical protein
MSKAVALSIQPAYLPTVSYGPFRLMEAVPWLMLASALRIIAVVVHGLVGLLAAVCSDIAIFLAFLLAARRMIELTDGKTGLGRLSFTEQLLLARKVLVPIILMMLLVGMAVAATGALWTAQNLMLGVDGIAFDQYSAIGMTWSAFLAAVMLLMVLRAESGGDATLLAVLRELWQRALCMVPAIIAVAAAHIGLSVLQGMVRVVVYAFWHVPGPPQLMRTFVFVLFVFGFASLRLWVTLAILTFALRESYRRGHAEKSGLSTSHG